MEVEVLAVTVNMKDSYKLLEEMNIQTNAIIGNQTSMVRYDKFIFRNQDIEILSFNERGVGLNRNNCLMRAKGDYCIIADDDLVFIDDYKEVINQTFKKYSDADIIIFNLIEEPQTRFITKKDFKVSWFNYMRFGAARIVIKRDSIIKNNIFFNLNFGGGTKYSAGEDTLFLNECLRKGLKIVAVTDRIATLTNDRKSSWFSGYNEKFFNDRGALYAALSPKLSKLICIQFLLRHKKLFIRDISLSKAYGYMKNGINEYNNW